MENQGASVVISHHVANGKQQEYEIWLDEIGPRCRRSVGFMDWQIIRPIPNLTFVYTVIIRFDTVPNLKNWMESDQRKELIGKANPLFTKEDQYLIRSGLDFLCPLENDNQKAPMKWKQYLVTWSAIYPLSVAVPLLVLPILRAVNVPDNRYTNSFFISGSVVFIMVYLLMPKYTGLIKKWLYRENG